MPLLRQRDGVLGGGQVDGRHLAIRPQGRHTARRSHRQVRHWHFCASVQRRHALGGSLLFHRDIVRQFRQVRGRHLAGGVQRRHAPGHALLGGGNRGVGRGLGFGGSLCRVRRGQLHRVDAGLHLGEVGVDFGHSVAQRVTRAIIVLLANGDLFKFLHSLYGTCRCVNVTEIVYQPPPIATN